MFLRELRQYSNRKLFIVLGGIIAVTFVTTVASVVAISALLVFRAGAQTHNDTRVQLASLLAGLSDAETGQRGYLLTGDSNYLATYDNVIKQIPGQLDAIVDKTEGGVAHSDAASLKPLVQLKLQELAHTITLRQAGDSSGSLAVVESGTGQTLMDQIRTTAKKVQSDESAQLTHDRDTVTFLGMLARDISIVSMLATLALALAVYWLYLKAIQSERALDRAKDEFVALASHQLRTPATGIKSILSTLVDGDFGPLNERQAYFIKRALESNERELGIIEELLNVAKADAGRLILHTSEFDLDELIQSVAGEQRGAIEKKKQVLVVRRADRPVMVVADEEKLFMAIGNLLDNARKYTPEEGKLTLAISRRRGDVLVEVTDTGIGIDPEEVGHIFDRFHRAGDAISGNVEGAGLGLYLAGRIAQLHGGAIEVTSKLGKGTKFVMILPQGVHNVAEGAAS